MRVKIKMKTGTKVHLPDTKKPLSDKCTCQLPETDVESNYGYCPYCGFKIK